MADYNLTDREHLKWAITDWETGEVTTFGTRKSANDLFTFELGRCTRPVKSWWEEFNIAMEKMVDEHGTDLALFYSGGSDSEIVLDRLLHLGVKPTIFTIKFTNGSNKHETDFADEFCKSRGLRQYVSNFDIDHYIQTEAYMDIAMKYTTSQIAYIVVLEHIRNVDKTAIMGGEVYFQRHMRESIRCKDEYSWYYIYREDEDGCTYRYTKDTGHKIINEVFTYTPEVLYAWLKTPEVTAVANNEFPGKVTLLSVKRGAYEREMGRALFAQTKFHGYEMMAWRNANIKRKILEQLPKMKFNKFEYSTLLQHLEHKQ
jgi:hypothetical protein